MSDETCAATGITRPRSASARAASRSCPDACRTLGMHASAARDRSGARRAADDRRTRSSRAARAGLALRGVLRRAGEPGRGQRHGGVAAYRSGRHDGVIAFGGGSALDTGKAIALMVGQTRPIWDFEDREDWYTRVERRRHGAVVARADDGGHRLGGRPRLGHHRCARSHQEDHLSSEDAAGARDRGSGAHDRAAAEGDCGGRHGRAVAQSRSVLLAVLSPDGRRHRGRRHAARSRSGCRSRCATARISRRARTCWSPRRWARPRSRRGSARCTA